MNEAVIRGREYSGLSGRVPELDGIRGIAIGMVLVYHYFLIMLAPRPGSALAYALVPGRLAWSGVDLFFVLSGFLIGGILLDARNSSNYFRVFYTRRFLRIVPIYVVLLSFAFLLRSVTHSKADEGFSWLLRDQLPGYSYALFLQNFWMAAGNTLGSNDLGITWSLAIEEQFYLTLPLLIRCLSPKRLIQVVVFGILGAPVLQTTLHALWPDHTYSSFALMPCRADALLLGVLGAIAMRDERCRSWMERNSAFFLPLLLVLASGVAFLMLMSPSPYGILMLTVGYSWMAVFYLALLLFALTQRESFWSRCLRWRWLMGLGSIAYGAYLFHQLVQGLVYGGTWSRAPLILTAGNLFVSVLALSLTIAACWLSWKYFEKPLVQIGHRVKYRFEEARAVRPLVALGTESSGV